jgi:peptidoglycan/LPS O-acetylase OafA/YrhL
MRAPGTHNTNNFTLLRNLLALSVVLGHFKLLSGTTFPPFPFNLADAAVDSFFVVSGYLIAASYVRAPALLPFYLRRVFRLYPLYVCVVLIQTVIMLLLLPAGPFSAPYQTLRYLGFNLLFMNFAQYDIGGVLSGLPNPGINPSLWTLKIEIGFYLIVPAVCAAVRRWGPWVLGAIFAASVAYDVVLSLLGHEVAAKQLPGQMQFFVVGMGLWMYGRSVRVAPGVAWTVCIVFLLCWTFLSPIPAGIRPCVVGAFVFCFALCLPVSRMQFDISYDIYLIHGPLIQTLLVLGLLRDSLAWLACVVATVLLLAVVAERFVERPGNEFGRLLSVRVGRRSAGAVSGVA